MEIEGRDNRILSVCETMPKISKIQQREWNAITYTFSLE